MVNMTFDQLNSFGLLVLVLYINLFITLVTADCLLSLRALFFWYVNFLVIFVRYAESWSSCSDLGLPGIFKIWSRSRILLHILLQPFRELSFISKPKTNTFCYVWLKACINIVPGFSWLFWARVKSVGLWHAVN